MYYGWETEKEMLEKGYCIGDGDGEVLGALCLMKIDDLNRFDNDDDAAEQAEKDGISIIRDIETDLLYIDTPENRKLVEEYYKHETKG